MKPHSIFLVAAAMAVAACSPKRLSPIVLQEPAPAKSSPAKSAPVKPVASKPVANRVVATATSSHSHAPAVAAHSQKAPVRSSVSYAKLKADEAARLAEKKKRIAAARRAQARKLAQASYEAGRQLLRENQAEPALRAFRESVRLNSHSPDAWMGVAYICEITGNTKDAVEAFRAAKKLWGM
jgi:Flp pilus assembly protein TadD